MDTPTLILYPALHLLLIDKLQAALQTDTNLLKITRHSQNQANNNGLLAISSGLSQIFHLRKVKDVTQVKYVSAIALRLEKQLNIPAADLAVKISSNLLRLIENSTSLNTHHPLDGIWQNLTVQTVSSHWIEMSFNDAGIASWLQLITDGFLQLNNQTIARIDSENDNQLLRDSTNLFTIQYTHARCCSLLRLANQEGLVIIANLHPLPWLTSNQSLCLDTPQERHLVADLIHTLDAIPYIRPANFTADCIKVALRLSQKFQDFYASCQLFGPIQHRDQPRAQARLGLVLATQSVLRFILDTLEMVAPVEL